ncbi:hypothetical protein AJ80_09097 [Polytolypa hystricis UAMH7299]|uniref:Rhodopsin domain-containing protein n=1 Tax=Polytolypa hystricis (strain UAMH7299) TaxID=1447883 RepID=A0A2B7WW77_POLH7|nr:hypothetical protein AJ80_09097 [Polytolypa hystricis UAMH7299]
MALSTVDLTACADNGHGPEYIGHNPMPLQMVIGNSYATSIPFSKCSILVFYLPLSQDCSFRIPVYLALTFVIASKTSAVMVIIFSCNPVAASWDLRLSELPSTLCVNRPANYLAQSSFHIFSDISIFACEFLDSADVLIWFTIEAHVTIIRACCPHLKPLFNHFLSGFLRSSASRGTYPPHGTVGRSKSQGFRRSSTNRSAIHDYEIYRGVDYEDSGRTVTAIETGMQKGSESQESILDDISTKVFVTRTRHVN